LETCLEKINEYEEKNFDIDNLDEIVKIVEESMAYIQQSREQLEFDSIFSTKLYSTSIMYLQSLFHPQLPSDFVIDFSSKFKNKKVNTGKIRFSFRLLNFNMKNLKLESDTVLVV
jgi:hypothetical protein